MPELIEMINNLSQNEHKLDLRINLAAGLMIKSCPNALAELDKYEKSVEKRMFNNFVIRLF